MAFPSGNPRKTGLAPPMLSGNCTVTVLLIQTMFIQKTFHVQRGLEETRKSLRKIHLYQQHLDGVKKAVVTDDGVGQFDCQLRDGRRAHCVLAELPVADPNQALFHSTAGNVDLSGMIEFVPIRDRLTEVQLTVECSFKSPIYNLFDAVTSHAEQFIDRQLSRLESLLNGANSTAPVDEAPGYFVAHLPQMAH
jgi:hypothetical protein